MYKNFRCKAENPIKHFVSYPTIEARGPYDYAQNYILKVSSEALQYFSILFITQQAHARNCARNGAENFPRPC